LGFHFYFMTNVILEKKETDCIVPLEAQPFYYKAGKKAIFFVHGFSDSLCRVNGFAKFLAAKGITAKGVLLPGHGKSWEDLAKTNPNDWYKEVERGILELSREVRNIYVVGISFGGNLALKFAAKHPGVVRGIVTIETPMKLNRTALIKMAIPFFEKMNWPYWNKKFLKKLKHPEKETVFSQGVHDKMPVVNIMQIVRFLERQNWLSDVTCDVMDIQSKKSHLITPDSAGLLLPAVRSERKEIMYITNVYHAFLSESEKKKIFWAAAKFFKINL